MYVSPNKEVLLVKQDCAPLGSQLGIPLEGCDH